MSAQDFTPRDVLIEAAIAEVDLHLPAELHIADRTDLEARELRPGRFAFATAGSLFSVASGVSWQVRTQDPERGEVTAYRDGVWLGRAIVPVDAIAPGERRRSGTKWAGLEVRSWLGSLLGPGAWVAEVEPTGATQPWSYVPLILYGWGYRPSGPFASARS